ncbi:4Fe-4S dicluster domain-containing protein [Shewanella goraebulensis]|uniref:4Fe-4S dicluster domain-containing protein n=1 Tax=Shewanella goraebulensis TaxID=3050637 RepID=UPI0025504F7C|nr:4Fe-4S dicluster domain-containing protein [Shewanella goraebulensis]
MINRRDILKTMGLGVLFSQVSYSALANQEIPNKRYAMVIDVRRCSGCKSCEVSCAIENKTPEGRGRTSVKQLSLDEAGVKNSVSIPMQCNQCSNPVCIDACPVSATGSLDNGIVYIDHDECISCQLCTEACPYGARIADSEFHLTPQKCNFCFHRLEAGLLPACVESCTGSARIFGDLSDPKSQISETLKSNKFYTILANAGTEPNIFYIGLPEQLVDQQLITISTEQWQR